jgi:endoglucanase
VQDTLNAGLDIVGNGTGDWERLAAVVTNITGRGLYCVLDPHNFATYKLAGVNTQIGSSGVPTSALEDFWTRVATIYKTNDLVWFNLMNEPNGIAATRWATIAQSVINAIRATGAKNKILVPGMSFTGAHSWVTSGNAAALVGLTDPANNFAFDVHQYLDSDSSGSHGTCTVGAGASRLDAFTTWCQANGKKGFLGEFAGGDPTVSGQEQCGTELPVLIDDMENNTDAWIGWTAWGGGTRWVASYIFRLEPVALTDPDTIYMQELTPYL